MDDDDGGGGGVNKHCPRRGRVDRESGRGSSSPLGACCWDGKNAAEQVGLVVRLLCRMSSSRSEERSGVDERLRVTLSLLLVLLVDDNVSVSVSSSRRCLRR